MVVLHAVVAVGCTGRGHSGSGRGASVARCQPTLLLHPQDPPLLLTSCLLQLLAWRLPWSGVPGFTIAHLVLNGSRPEVPPPGALPGPNPTGFAGLDAYCQLMRCAAGYCRGLLSAAALVYSSWSGIRRRHADTQSLVVLTARSRAPIRCSAL